MASKEICEVCAVVPHFLTGDDSHDLCVVCLGAENTQTVLAGADCVNCA